ncbi:hypothetical protein [Verrucosispora sp. ts21]|uniref:hypothetical protein n=1 Tax=Verrucosispora sp. ts21 TaxID=2069341 RepID=UPI0011AF7C1C|nr:hypothetical protein [Verrucosispora sp. ts21]
MSAERGFIDLGDHDHQSLSSGRPAPDRVTGRRKMGVRLVAAFVVGMVLGGVAVNQLRDSREERERNSSISLVAFVASGGSGGGDARGIYQMAGQLTVINAGPAPITVRATSGQLPGIRVRGAGQSPLLRPGGTAWIEVEVRIDCSIPFGSEPLSTRFTVEAADGRVREVSHPVAVIGSAWHREVEQPCAHLADLVKRDG